ncbi:hypothetical protein V8F33_013456 [Rhypophila sp. PSN 637]
MADREAPRCIGIIAIHGLNGHYLNTWTDPKTGFNWLKEVIPGVVATARVMSCSYNSILQFSKSTSGIRVFAQQLLECISAERTTDVEQERATKNSCSGDKYQHAVIHGTVSKVRCTGSPFGIIQREVQYKGQVQGSISRFTRHARWTISTAWPTPRLKILVTSRPENQVKITFEKRRKQIATGSLVNKRMGVIRLRGEDEVDAISQDITLVVRDKIHDVVSQGLPDKLLETVEVELIRRADWTFLWLLACSRKRLKKAHLDTSSLPRAETRQKSRKMLSIILGATRALTVEELSIALAVTPQTNDLDPRGSAAPLRSHYKPLRPGKTTFDHILYDLVSPFEHRIKSLCGQFTRIIRNKVYLVHETAREFLLSHWESADSSTSLWTVPSLPRPATKPGSFM